MRQLYERVDAAAKARGTILIVGESGTGKELVARAIHEGGPNPNAPFIALNCAAIPKDLIESELFGYKRGGIQWGECGVYRPHPRSRRWDPVPHEVTEMSPDTQSKLLRAIQEHSVRPVGSTREVLVETRVVASSNRDPIEAVRSGQLRNDLYYRMQASIINIPSLKERLEDIPLLVEHFIDLFNARHARPTPVTGIDEKALEAMRRYEWPGNVRELANALESAFTFGHSHLICLQDLPPVLSGLHAREHASKRLDVPVGSFADSERTIIERALEFTEGNKVQAAKLLRISRKKLYAKIAKYGLK